MMDQQADTRLPVAPAFTQQLLDRCLTSATQQGTQSFQFGNTVLKAVFIGAYNTDFFTKAVAHRQVTYDKPDLTVFVVDYTTSSVMLPPPCWNWQQADGYGTIHGLAEGYQGYFQQDTGVFTWVAYQEQLAVIWVNDMSDLPEWEQSFPFRYVLHKWLERNNDYVLVHAGAVGTVAGGVLLTGAGGSGKSTSTLACINSSLRYAGDDFVMIDLKNQVVHSLYNVAKIAPDNLDKFPQLVPWVANPNAAQDQKYQVFIAQHNPTAVIAEFPIKAMLLPRFSGAQNTNVRPATAAEALKALAPSTLALLRADQRTFQKMIRLVHLFPCFWLETGTDLAQIPDSISLTLQSLSSHEFTPD